MRACGRLGPGTLPRLGLRAGGMAPFASFSFEKSPLTPIWHNT